MFSTWDTDTGQRRFICRWRASYPEVAMPEPAVGVKLRRGSLPRHAPALDDGVAVGELHQALDVLVDHQDGLSGGARSRRGSARSPRARAARGLRSLRRGSGDGVGDERAADGEHLLLAAGKLVSHVLGLAEAGKRTPPGPGVALPSGSRRRRQVLAHAQVGEDLPPLGTTIPMRAMRSGASRSIGGRGS